MPTTTVLNRSTVNQSGCLETEKRITVERTNDHPPDGEQSKFVQVEDSHAGKWQVPAVKNVRDYALELIRDERELDELVEYAASYAQSIGV